MDYQRLLLTVLQRLSPLYVATALWMLTDYFAIMIGGVALSIVLTVAWPFLQPFLAVLYEEILQQRSQVQAQHRTQFLKTVLPFLNAYKAVVAKYPPALLATSAPAMTAQLAILAEALRQSDRRSQRASDDPFATHEPDPHAFVHATAFNPRELGTWELHACKTWATQLCTQLAAQKPTLLQQAVQHFAAHHAKQTWQTCLAAAEHALDTEVDQAVRQWACLQKARDNPEIRQRLTTLLRLDAVNRQANLKPYLSSKPVACTPAEVRDVMASIRYDTVAARVLALLEDAARRETLAAAPG